MAFREVLVHIHGLWATPLQLLLMIPIMALTFGMPSFVQTYDPHHGPDLWCAIVRSNL
jgi:hypothetical protein